MSVVLVNGSANNRRKALNLLEIDPPVLDGQLKGASLQDNIVVVIGSIWNGYNLYTTWKKVKISSREIRALRRETRKPLPSKTVAATKFASILGGYRAEIRAHEEFIKRCHFKMFSCGLNVLKASVIFITNPYWRKGIEGTINTAANLSLVGRELTTRTREQLLTPEAVTWKDDAHHWFNTSTAAIGVCFGVLTLAVSFGCMDEEDFNFQMVRRVSIASTVLGVFYGGLQRTGFLAERD